MKNEIIKNDLTVIETNNKRFTTLDLNDEENANKLYNSLQKCDILINDIVGEELEFSDVYIEARKIGETVNEETGETLDKEKFRTILYGTDGNTYVSSSYGVYNSIRSILAIFGNPTSEKPYKVKIAKRLTKDVTKSTLVLIKL